MTIIPDVSFYQYRYNPRKEINFVKMREKCHAVIIRAGQNVWVDVECKRSMELAKDAGLLRGSYWFYDSRANPKRQAEKWVDVLGNDVPEMELWMDYEDKYGGQFGKMTDLYNFAERLRSLIPNVRLGVYTGYYYWLEHLSPAESYFAQYPLWIAAYGTDKPRIPPTWTSYRMHQYTDNGTGAEYGAASGNIDLNRFNGDFEARYGKVKSLVLQAHYGNQTVEYRSK